MQHCLLQTCSSPLPNSPCNSAFFKPVPHLLHWQVQLCFLQSYSSPHLHCLHCIRGLQDKCTAPWKAEQAPSKMTPTFDTVDWSGFYLSICYFPYFPTQTTLPCTLSFRALKHSQSGHVCQEYCNWSGTVVRNEANTAETYLSHFWPARISSAQVLLTTLAADVLLGVISLPCPPSRPLQFDSKP